MLLPFFLSYRQYRYLVIVTIVAMLLVVFWVISRIQPKFILSDYQRYHCTTANSAIPDVFTILMPTSFLAIEFADALCAEASITARFGLVEVNWPSRQSLNSHDLIDGRYKLLWNRHPVLQGLLLHYQQYYQEITHLPDYTLYFLHKHSKPELTAAFFRHKTLGLLEDEGSYSGYQLPLAVLNDAGLASDTITKKVYPDRQSLKQAFIEDRVDIISDAIFGSQKSPLSDSYYGLLIVSDVDSGSWFLYKQDIGLLCSLLQVLSFMQPLSAQFGQADIEKNTACQQ